MLKSSKARWVNGRDGLRVAPTLAGRSPDARARPAPAPRGRRAPRDPHAPTRRIARAPAPGLALAGFLAAALFSPPAAAAGPPQPAERAAGERERMIEHIAFLEERPFDALAASRRATVKQWLEAHSGLRVAVYAGPFREVLATEDGSSEYAGLLVKQLVFSTASYHLRHPGTDANSLDAVVAFG